MCSGSICFALCCQFSNQRSEMHSSQPGLQFAPPWPQRLSETGHIRSEPGPAPMAAPASPSLAPSRRRPPQFAQRTRTTGPRSHKGARAPPPASHTAPEGPPAPQPGGPAPPPWPRPGRANPRARRGHAHGRRPAGPPRPPGGPVPWPGCRGPGRRCPTPAPARPAPAPSSHSRSSAAPAPAASPRAPPPSSRAPSRTRAPPARALCGRRAHPSAGSRGTRAPNCSASSAGGALLPPPRPSLNPNPGGSNQPRPAASAGRAGTRAPAKPGGVRWSGGRSARSRRCKRWPALPVRAFLDGVHESPERNAVHEWEDLCLWGSFCRPSCFARARALIGCRLKRTGHGLESHAELCGSCNRIVSFVKLRTKKKEL